MLVMYWEAAHSRNADPRCCSARGGLQGRSSAAAVMPLVPQPGCAQPQNVRGRQLMPGCCALHLVEPVAQVVNQDDQQARVPHLQRSRRGHLLKQWSTAPPLLLLLHTTATGLACMLLAGRTRYTM